ncbi:MAG: hypothetical protein CAF41_011880 [Nitrospira sp. CG24A]|nr:MAG: hypothetical protein CAF41_011880 [Nitrospira sp. CG24A]
MNPFQMIKSRSLLVVALVGVAGLWFPTPPDGGQARAVEPSSANLREQGDGLMQNVEDMVAHGGMGDAKAIVHHCGEAARFAKAIIKQLPLSDGHGTDAMASLNEVIRQCSRVSDIGIHADPGQLLNPATKARTAAQESIKLLGLTRTNKG